MAVADLVSLPAAIHPFLKVWTFGANRRVVAVAGEHDRVIGKREEQGVNRCDDGVEISTFILSCSRPAWEERVAGEEKGSAVEVE